MTLFKALLFAGAAFVAAPSFASLPADSLTASALAAAADGNSEAAIDLLLDAQRADTTWHCELIAAGEELEDCRLSPRWAALTAENERRTAIAHPEYDHALRRELLDLYDADQNPRGRLIMAGKQNPDDRETLSRLWKDIRVADSINQPRATAMRDSLGWIPSAKVGAATQGLFFVIQHADPATIGRYIDLFEKAALAGELPRKLFAKMKDRSLLYSGQPQIYGTQKVCQADTGKMIIWRLRDKTEVNALRREMDLPPLSPEDFADAME